MRGNRFHCMVGVGARGDRFHCMVGVGAIGFTVWWVWGQ